MLTMQDIAAEYAAAPVYCPTALAGWRQLAVETLAHAERIERELEVSYTALAEPYLSAADMLADIARGRVTISVANSEHPVWTLRENCAFRLVHDVLGHGLTGSGFDWAGELSAYDRHYRLTRHPSARLALFTEAVGQVAYALTYGGFGPQKVAYLPTWMSYDPALDIQAAVVRTAA